MSRDGQYWNQIDYILCSQRWRSSIQSAKIRPGIDCGSVHELLIAKFRLKLKKVGKTTRPLRYDLNQIPYDYTVEVRSRFKGIRSDRVPEELWMGVHDIVQEAGIKTIPKKRKCSTIMDIFKGSLWNDDIRLGTSGKCQPVPSVCIGKVAGFHGQLHVAKDCLGHVFPKTFAHWDSWEYQWEF